MTQDQSAKSSSGARHGGNLWHPALEDREIDRFSVTAMPRPSSTKRTAYVIDIEMNSPEVSDYPLFEIERVGAIGC